MAQYTQRKDIFEAVNYAVVTHLLLCQTDERLSCNATFSVFGLVTCGSREHSTERGIGPDRAQPRGSALESREFVIKTEVGLGDAGSGSNSDSALGFWMEVGSQDLGKCSDSPPRTHGNAVPKAESVLIGPYRVGRPKQRGNSASKPKSVRLAPIFGLGLGVLAGSRESGHRIVLRLTTQDPQESGTESGIGLDRSLPSGSAQAAREFGIKTEVGRARAHIWTRPWRFGWESGLGSRDLGQVNNTPSIESIKEWMH
ncbi:hypothetical protein BKA70DRAFT_1221548 [Coprinopsis sp. MPI-PUGE-AT-0042]|nr:hypothetical protein BKA70DRAFT_1221548 [Coprinopsis sp. MPI-PUGE-AT-0042]